MVCMIYTKKGHADILSAKMKMSYQKNLFVYTASNFTLASCLLECNDLVFLEDQCTKACNCIDSCLEDGQEYEKCSKMCAENVLNRGE